MHKPRRAEGPNTIAMVRMVEGKRPNESALRAKIIVPAVIAAADKPDSKRASARFLEFFTAKTVNPHTRRAYYLAVTDFFKWCGQEKITINSLQPKQVAAWVELQQQRYAAPTVKLRLAAIRHLFDWLLTGAIVSVNPAASVRGPSYTADSSSRPVLSPDETRSLIDRIDVTKVVGLRDRALIGLMVFGFARVGAALDMKVEDVFSRYDRQCVLLGRESGRQYVIPCHDDLEAYLTAYIKGAGLAGEPTKPLFRTIGRGTNELTSNPLAPANAYAMIRRRAKAVGITKRLGTHTFRAAGIAAFLRNGGTLERAAQLANHASTSTTQLYHKRRHNLDDELTLQDVKRIRI